MKFDYWNMTYLEYRNLIDVLISQNKTTGNTQSEDLFQYTQLNIKRMEHLDYSTQLFEEWQPFFKNLNSKLKWVVLTEGWCGDAAQLVPVFNKIAKASDGKIDLQILLRDENLELMDKYLTNGGRAIPKLICFDEFNNELWNWGPRPKDAQVLIDNLKEKQLDMNELKTELHSWYSQNKTLEVQLEVFQKFEQLN